MDRVPKQRNRRSKKHGSSWTARSKRLRELLDIDLDGASVPSTDHLHATHATQHHPRMIQPGRPQTHLSDQEVRDEQLCPDVFCPQVEQQSGDQDMIS